MPVLAINLCEVVLKTLFYKNYFFIFFTPSIRFPSCKEVHPLKCSLEKLYGGEGGNHIYILKPTPAQKRTHPLSYFNTMTFQKLPGCLLCYSPTITFILERNVADVKGGFLVLHTVCSENQVKRWNLNKNVAKCVFSSNLFYWKMLKFERFFEIVRFSCKMYKE